MKKIFSIFSDFQSKFSYRKRFLFIAIAFFIFIPIPSYIALQTYNFFIYRAELQELGVRYQSQLALILNNAIRYQIVENTRSFGGFWKDSELKELDRKIYESFQKLNNLEPQLYNLKPISFGRGFSINERPTVHINPIQNMWREVQEQNPNITILDFAEKIIALMRSNCYNFKLFLFDDSYYYQTAVFAYIVLPDLQASLLKLYLAGLEKGDLETKLAEYDKNPERSLLVIEKIYKTYDDPNKVSELISFLKEEVVYLREENKDLKALYLMENSKNLLSNPFFQVTYERILKSIQRIEERTSSTLHNGIYESLTYFRDVRRHLYYFFIITAIIVVLAAVLRLFTRHLAIIRDHISDLSKGIFKERLYYNEKDEFTKIGLAMNKLGNILNTIFKKLEELGIPLTTSTWEIQASLSRQEAFIKTHELNIKNSESNALAIIENTRALANKMDDLSLASEQKSLTQEANNSLNIILSFMTKMANDSKSIVNTFDEISRHMEKMNSLTDFMTKLCDQAKLLSLNAAIEEVNTSQSFNKITMEIQRFADNTALASANIQSIIDEVTGSMRAARKAVNKCVQDIGLSFSRLRRVGSQLTIITRKFQEQTNRFENVSRIMQNQFLDAENMIEAMKILNQSSQSSSGAFTQLNSEITQLSNATRELTGILTLFRQRKESNENID